MPAYTCDGYRSPTGELVESIPEGADSTAFAPARVPHRPIESIAPADPGFWFLGFAYTWPLLILALREALAARQRMSRWLLWGEPVLAISSAYLIWQNASSGEIAYGTWVACSVLAFLLGAAVTEIIVHRPSRGSGRSAS